MRAAGLSALAGEMITQGDDCDDMERLLLPNVAMCPAKSIWFIEKKDSRIVGMYRASTW